MANILNVEIDGEQHWVNQELLRADLAKDGYSLRHLRNDGELQIEDESGIVEIWQARVEGCGCNNTIWGDLPGGYEFCSSYTP